MDPFVWAAGGGSFQLDAGDYIASVVFIAGQSCQTDQLCFMASTPVRGRSWGAVKELFR